MNVAEGFRRVAIIIRWVGFLFALAFLGSIFMVRTWADGGMLLLLAVIVAVASQGLAWMIDGFAAPHK